MDSTVGKAVSVDDATGRWLIEKDGLPVIFYYGE